MAIDAVEPSQRLPIWSVAPPVVASTAYAVKGRSGNEQLRFRDVISGFVNWASLLKVLHSLWLSYFIFYC